MKKLQMLAVVLLVSITASASTVDDAMFVECERQMALGTCTALTDKNDYPPGARVLIPGKGFVSLEAYLRVKNADKAMCALVKTACETDPGNGECRIAHALWGN